MPQQRLRQIENLLARMKDRPAVTFSLKALQLAAVAGVLLFLSGKLGHIGWDKVMASLPTTPWFYLFFSVMYLAYPVAEQRVYRRIWAGDKVADLSVFLRMRVYNFAVLSYSGEAFLALWASKNLDEKKGRIFSNIKDSNILSALASNSFTILLLVALFASGQLHHITDADADFRYYLALAVLVGVILIPTVIHFRNHLIALDGPTARAVFGTHLIRQIIVLLAQVAMWSVAVPEVPMTAWLLLLTAQMVLTRVPFLPNTDLLLAGLGITLIGYLAAPESKLAGMFFAAGVLGQIANLAVFALASMPRPAWLRRPRTKEA